MSDFKKHLDEITSVMVDLFGVMVSTCPRERVGCNIVSCFRYYDKHNYSSRSQSGIISFHAPSGDLIATTGQGITNIHDSRLLWCMLDNYNQHTPSSIKAFATITKIKNTGVESKKEPYPPTPVLKIQTPSNTKHDQRVHPVPRNSKKQKFKGR